MLRDINVQPYFDIAQSGRASPVRKKECYAVHQFESGYRDQLILLIKENNIYWVKGERSIRETFYHMKT